MMGTSVLGSCWELIGGQTLSISFSLGGTTPLKIAGRSFQQSELSFRSLFNSFSR